MVRIPELEHVKNKRGELMERRMNYFNKPLKSKVGREWYRNESTGKGRRRKSYSKLKKNNKRFILYFGECSNS